MSCPENGYGGAISESQLGPIHIQEKTENSDPPLYLSWKHDPSLYTVLNTHNTQYSIKKHLLQKEDNELYIFRQV